MGAEYAQLERGSSVLYAACGGIWVMVLFAPPTKPDMLLARPALAAMKRQQPLGFPTLTWILPEAGFRMDNDARLAASQVTDEFESVIRAQATLIEGSGFQAATVRAIVAGLDAMTRSFAPKKVFSELAPSVAWCAERRPPGTPTTATSEIVQALGSTRHALMPRRA